ncbi:MAG: COG4315 family predicted lipoprotein [Streptosporangiaceae bacterium]
MRKSGWAAAAALGSLALLLAGCSGSSSHSGSTGSTAPAGQPSNNIGQFSPGDTVLIVQKSKLGYVLAEANGDVVYTYGNDKKGGPPSCTSSCAAVWPAVTGIPMTNAGEKLPGALGVVSMANGGKQITYDGYPLYIFKAGKPLATTGEGVDGLWHVIKLSASDIVNLGG